MMGLVITLAMVGLVLIVTGAVTEAAQGGRWMMGMPNERQLDDAMQRNLAAQASIQEWIEAAVSELNATVPGNIADIYEDLLRDVIGGVYASGWRNPVGMSRWWIERLRYFADRFNDIVAEEG